MSNYLIVCGAIWVLFACIQNTKNFRSAIVYKILPLISGLYVMLYGFGLFN